MAIKDDLGSGQLLDLLRGDILRCVLKPDTRLILEELKGRFGFGASPLREALMQLVADGLVVFEANRGFRVAPLSKDHFDDVARVRMALEVLEADAVPAPADQRVERAQRFGGDVLEDEEARHGARLCQTPPDQRQSPAVMLLSRRARLETAGLRRASLESARLARTVALSMDHRTRSQCG